MKNLTTIPALFIAIALSGCATLEEGTDSSEVSQIETGEADAKAGPVWYDHANRASKDSLFFYGFGLAVAVDSSSAHKEAQRQALAHLKLSIDRYLEEVRRKKAEEPGGEQFSTNRFIFDLRNAVQRLNLNQSLNYTIDHIEKEGSVHNIYVRASIEKDQAFGALNAELNHTEFLRFIRETSAR